MENPSDSLTFDDVPYDKLVEFTVHNAQEHWKPALSLMQNLLESWVSQLNDGWSVEPDKEELAKMQMEKNCYVRISHIINDLIFPPIEVDSPEKDKDETDSDKG